MWSWSLWLVSIFTFGNNPWTLVTDTTCLLERYKRRIHEKLRTINLLNKVYRFVCGSESRKDSCFVSRSSNCPQVDEMMHFRSSASLLYDYLWLPTSTMVLHSRESCFKQAQDVYEGLAKSSNGELEFNHVCAIASGQKDVDPDIAKDLEIFLSPNRTGKLSKISFLKSIDRYSTHFEIFLRQKFIPNNKASP